MAWLSLDTIAALNTWRPECHRIVTEAAERGVAKTVKAGTDVLQRGEKGKILPQPRG